MARRARPRKAMDRFGFAALAPGYAR